MANIRFVFVQTVTTVIDTTDVGSMPDRAGYCDWWGDGMTLVLKRGGVEIVPTLDVGTSSAPAIVASVTKSIDMHVGGIPPSGTDWPVSLAPQVP